VESSFQAETVIGAGRGALVAAIFGAGWLGWGFGEARAFTGIVGAAFGFIELFLLARSIYVIRAGRQLRKRYPPALPSTRRAILRSFLLVVLLEVLALLFVWVLASRLHRPELGTAWEAMVVGLHFLPLAKLFRSPRLGIIGILMTLWGDFSRQCPRDLGIHWNGNAALGCRPLRLVSCAQNRALTRIIESAYLRHPYAST
jgi:hypothetical protein